MSDVLTLQDAGNLVSYLAPGYFAQWAYHRRFPAREKPAGELAVLSTVLSPPFVALAHRLSPSQHDPTSVQFVCALLLPALLCGYIAALIRESEGVRAALGAMGIGEQPEASMWLRTFPYLTDDDWITVSFKDGTHLAGVIKSFPALPQDGVRELYLVYPEWSVDGHTFEPSDGEGVIINLDEVVAITLMRNPLDDAGNPVEDGAI